MLACNKMMPYPLYIRHGGSMLVGAEIGDLSGHTYNIGARMLYNGHWVGDPRSYAVVNA